MFKAVLATRNKHKIKELEALLAANGIELELLTLDDIGFAGEIEENGKTFEENAAIKADCACRWSNILSIADDSGLEVDALDNAPGIYSARYAGTGNDGDNNKKLLAELEGVEQDKRTARFVCVIAVSFPNGERRLARGVCEGCIGREPKGKGQFGYDPLFYYPPLGATFAELEPDEKNKVSHRAKAVAALAKILKEYV